MKRETEGLKEDLKELCIIVIDLLDQLKREKLLNEEDYQRHTELKKKFLEDK